MGDFYRKLGKRIKELRGHTDVSQQELAQRLQIPRPSVSQLEAGEREISADEIIKLAAIFNVSCDNLLNFEKEPEVTLQEIRKKPAKKEKVGLRINVPQKNLEKFKEVLLYILNAVGSKSNIGESVIYKILYFIDFDFYEKYEEQLIGATYIRNHYGPTPVEFRKIVERMIADKEIEKIKSEYFSYPQTKYLPLKEADISKLKPEEIKMINDVLNRLSDMNAAQISVYSHSDVPWLTTQEGEPIEYESVFYRTPPYSVREYGEDIPTDHSAS